MNQPVDEVIMLSPESKVKVQGAGRFLSNMVMPNIGAFIAWGLISALFIPSGWIPNEQLAELSGPMITYLLPLLIGYSGGRLIAGERGAVVGAVITMGLIAGSDIPMLMGAMIAGPFGGLAIKHFDAAVAGRIKSGFEMLVNNFSAGIIGMLGAILALYFIGPVLTVVSAMLSSGVEVLIQSDTLALVAIIVEPAKIIFLNNAINHGIFSPLGISQVQEAGQSIFFLIESNPGPGLGVLLAYAVTSKGREQQTAAGATIIHLFGGIQEVYFPYVLMKPRLLLAVIAGGITGIYVLTLFDAGLISPASPGSIIAILLMTAQSSLVGVVLSIAASTLVSFLVATLLLRHEIRRDELKSESNESLVGGSATIQLERGVMSQALKITPQHVCLNIEATSKEEVISILGQKLVDLGHVDPEYVDGMLKREALLPTYLGESIALPHGMIGGKQNINQNGIVFGQIPKGIVWGSEPNDIAQIVVAIAAKGDSHIQMISSISAALDDDSVLERLKTTVDANDVVRVFNGS